MLAIMDFRVSDTYCKGVKIIQTLRYSNSNFKTLVPIERSAFLDSCKSNHQDVDMCYLCWCFSEVFSKICSTSDFHGSFRHLPSMRSLKFPFFMNSYTSICKSQDSSTRYQQCCNKHQPLDLIKNSWWFLRPGLKFRLNLKVHTNQNLLIHHQQSTQDICIHELQTMRNLVATRYVLGAHYNRWQDGRCPLLLDEVVKPWQGHHLQVIMCLL